MKQRITKIRLTNLVVAAALLVATVGANLAYLGSSASAGTITARSITMSSSSPGNTGTTYRVRWTAAKTSTIKSIAIDFCSNSPIIGDTTCTAPSGFSLTGSPTVTLSSGITNTYTAATLNSNRTLTLTKAAGDAMTAGSTNVDFTINTVTNPSSDGTFYARIYTFPNDTGSNSAANYTVATPGTYEDAGGIALSAETSLSITAKVQETLTFCVYVTGSNCSGGTGTAIGIGDANDVLAVTTTTYTDTANFGIATNAGSGASITMKGGLPTSGVNTIDAYGGSCLANSGSSADERFGMRISTVGAGLTAAAPYNCTTNEYGFDTAAAAGTYGDVIATASGPLDEVQSTMTFAAKSAVTTPAGIYTTDLNFIATGLF